MDPDQAWKEVTSRLTALEERQGSLEKRQTDALERISEALTTLANAQTQEATPRAPRSRLPDPEKFNGNPGKWETWLPLIRAKTDVDGLALGDPTAQFWYVYGNLESKVQGLVLPLATVHAALHPDLILTYLARIYDDPHKERRAKGRLGQLKQGTDSFPSFLARFERCLLEAGGRNWPDDLKISALRASLGDSLKSRLQVQLALPTEYEAFLKASTSCQGPAAQAAEQRAQRAQRDTASPWI